MAMDARWKVYVQDRRFDDNQISNMYLKLKWETVGRFSFDFRPMDGDESYMVPNTTLRIFWGDLHKLDGVIQRVDWDSTQWCYHIYGADIRGLLLDRVNATPATVHSYTSDIQTNVMFQGCDFPTNVWTGSGDTIGKYTFKYRVGIQNTIRITGATQRWEMVLDRGTVYEHLDGCIYDATKDWSPNVYAGATLRLVSGACKNGVYNINGNTKNRVCIRLPGEPATLYTSGGGYEWCHLSSSVFGSPATRDDEVFAVDYSGNQMLLTSSGATVWSVSAYPRTAGNKHPYIWNGSYYIWSSGTKIHALSPDDGSEVWQFPATTYFSRLHNDMTLLPDGRIVTCEYYEGTAVCINTDGTQQWRSLQDLVNAPCPPNGIADDTTYHAVWRGGYAPNRRIGYSLSNGSFVYKVTPPTANIWGRVHLNSSGNIVGFGGTYMIVYSPTTGNDIRLVDVGADDSKYPDAVGISYDRTVIYRPDFTTGVTLIARDANTCDLIWTTPLRGHMTNASWILTCENGLIYVSQSEYLQCFDADGNEVWYLPTPTGEVGYAFAFDEDTGNLYVGMGNSLTTGRLCCIGTTPTGKIPGCSRVGDIYEIVTSSMTQPPSLSPATLVRDTHVIQYNLVDDQSDHTTSMTVRGTG